MPRTTLDLDSSVLRELRERAGAEGKSMGRLASELLAASVARQEDPTDGEPFVWASSDLGTPLVDLEDKEAVRAALDSEQ
ncbi:MAG: antitoxin [Gemmatimonadaceae bacterium]|nr:antitoxin [Gemmatimonadaceae bacterium]